MGVCAIQDLRRLNNSLYRVLFPRSKRGTVSSPVTWRMPTSTFRDTGSSSGSPSVERLTNTRFYPWASTKCMYVALALLRLQGIRILNYQDDWLILASSREQVIRHRDSLLLRLHALALWLNGQKSVLAPVQQTIFLEVCLDSTSM